MMYCFQRFPLWCSLICIFSQVYMTIFYQLFVYWCLARVMTDESNIWYSLYIKCITILDCAFCDVNFLYICIPSASCYYIDMMYNVYYVFLHFFKLCVMITLYLYLWIFISNRNTSVYKFLTSILTFISGFIIEW